MMRWIAALFLLASPASAMDCAQSREGLVDVADWSVSGAGGDTESHISLVSRLESDTRLISGIVVFSDTLGADIGVVPITRDAPLSPNAVVTQTTRAGWLSRLHDLDRSDVSVKTCVSAVVYTDGTKEEFR